jgi:hypothetical protein
VCVCVCVCVCARACACMYIYIYISLISQIPLKAPHRRCYGINYSLVTQYFRLNSLFICLFTYLFIYLLVIQLTKLSVGHDIQGVRGLKVNIAGSNSRSNSEVEMSIYTLVRLATVKEL